MTTNPKTPAPSDAVEVTLKPCPFCGANGTAMHDGNHGIWSVTCNNDGTCGDDVVGCGMIGPERRTMAEAITAWNTRLAAEQSTRLAQQGDRVEPVAWMYERDGKVRIDHGAECSEPMLRGWKATPLFGGVERLREALEAIENGTIDRPLGKPWRDDGTPSKLDRCIHDVGMSECCEACIDAHCRAALASTGEHMKESASVGG